MSWYLVCHSSTVDGGSSSMKRLGMQVIEIVVILRNSSEIYAKQETHPNINIVNLVGMEPSTGKLCHSMPNVIWPRHRKNWKAKTKIIDHIIQWHTWTEKKMLQHIQKKGWEDRSVPPWNDQQVVRPTEELKHGLTDVQPRSGHPSADERKALNIEPWSPAYEASILLLSPRQNGLHTFI